MIFHMQWQLHHEWKFLGITLLKFRYEKTKISIELELWWKMLMKLVWYLLTLTEIMDDIYIKHDVNLFSLHKNYSSPYSAISLTIEFKYMF